MAYRTATPAQLLVPSLSHMQPSHSSFRKGGSAEPAALVEVVNLMIYGHLLLLCPSCNWCISCLMEAHTEGNNSARNGSSDRGSHHR